VGDPITVVGRKTRRAEDSMTIYYVCAPVLSRAVDMPPRRVWRGRRTIISWAMQRARMAQIRRDPASEVVSVSPRRDFRPTGSWVPFRPFADTPTRYLRICSRASRISCRTKLRSSSIEVSLVARSKVILPFCSRLSRSQTSKTWA
jgi:hypothetical protein